MLSSNACDCQLFLKNVQEITTEALRVLELPYYDDNKRESLLQLCGDGTPQNNYKLSNIQKQGNVFFAGLFKVCSVLYLGIIKSRNLIESKNYNDESNDESIENDIKAGLLLLQNEIKSLK